MDLSLNRWNMARHQWENIKCFYYHDQVVHIEAFDTKGGQKSIFNDDIEGAFHIRIWHELEEKEMAFIKDHYGHLSNEAIEVFIRRLTCMNIGEMQPQYIMRYGFYEGHTFWRTDPVALSFIFGFMKLSELHQLFAGQLDKKLMSHHERICLLFNFLYPDIPEIYRSSGMLTLETNLAHCRQTCRRI